MDPVVDNAVKSARNNSKYLNDSESPEAKAILDLKVLDPAVGSGHFLIAVAHRLARRLAAVRLGEEEPSPRGYRTALRDIIANCLYGIDTNPMAVELCKVSLWMEAVEEGKPLPFLDHHIRLGNSLLGANLSMISDGIPDSAFDARDGDDLRYCQELKQLNREEREGQNRLISANTYNEATLVSIVNVLESQTDEDIHGIHEKERQLERFHRSEAFTVPWFLADAFCASYSLRKKKGRAVVTTGTLRHLEKGGTLSEAEKQEISEVAVKHKFFHPHLAYPEVFSNGGFDLVLGNPPWERVKIQEKEWFSIECPEIATANRASQRQSLIAALAQTNPDLFASFQDALREAESEASFLRTSGRFPLTGRGDINTYALFAELAWSFIRGRGQVGIVVPSGIATDDTTRHFFQAVITGKSLISLLSFYEIRRFFPGTDSRIPFCLLTLCSPEIPNAKAAQFLFGARSVRDVTDPQKVFALSVEDIALLNPSTLTCPVFQSSRDAEITKSVYRRMQLMISQKDGNPWALTFMAMFHMTNGSHIFQEVESRDQLPLLEAKMISIYDHRAADVVLSANAIARHGQSDILNAGDHRDPYRSPAPRYWVSSQSVDQRLLRTDRSGNVVWRWTHEWLIGWRNITNNSAERTMLISILPRVAAGNSLSLMFPEGFSASMAGCLVANLSSFVFDYLARQKIGGTNMNYHVLKQLAVVIPKTLREKAAWDNRISLHQWLAPRVLELQYSAWDLNPYSVECGFNGEPFKWDQERRSFLRAEIDAAFFHLYAFERDEVDHAMDSFGLVKSRETEKSGSYHTKQLILEAYDSLAHATVSQIPYESTLTPSPAFGWIPAPDSSWHQNSVRSAVAGQDAGGSLELDERAPTG